VSGGLASAVFGLGRRIQAHLSRTSAGRPTTSAPDSRVARHLINVARGGERIAAARKAASTRPVRRFAAHGVRAGAQPQAGRKATRRLGRCGARCSGRVGRFARGYASAARRYARGKHAAGSVDSRAVRGAGSARFERANASRSFGRCEPGKARRRLAGGARRPVGQASSGRARSASRG